MLQAASPEGGSGRLLEDIRQAPELLERAFQEVGLGAEGATVLDSGLPLREGVEIDFVVGDSQGQPFLVLVDEGEAAEGALCRALGVLAEVGRVRGLLERLYRQQGVSLTRDPRVVILCQRASDRLLDALACLPAVAVEVVEGRLARVGEALGLTAHHPRGGPMAVGASPTSAGGAASPGNAAPPPGRRVDPAVTGGGAGGDLTPAAERSRSSSSFEPGRSAEPAEPGQPAGSRDAAVAVARQAEAAEARAPVAEQIPGEELLDEAKRKILRIGDEIEEQVDGDLVRFLVRERVLAVLARNGSNLALYVGDQPHRRRPVQDRVDLAVALDEIFRRYFSLIRSAAPNGR